MRVTTDADGEATVLYPGGGWHMYGQWILEDPDGIQGRALSNALEIFWGN